MPHRAENEALKFPSAGEGGVLPPHIHEQKSELLQQEITLGVSSRSSLIEMGRESATPVERRGLLLAPPEVEMEVARQKAGRTMTPDYRQTLHDRLTMALFFADVEVAFRRTPQGIEVLAAGLDEIAEFRRTSTREQREGVVYGVG